MEFDPTKLSEHGTNTVLTSIATALLMWFLNRKKDRANDEKVKAQTDKETALAKKADAEAAKTKSEMDIDEEKEHRLSMDFDYQSLTRLLDNLQARTAMMGDEIVKLQSRDFLRFEEITKLKQLEAECEDDRKSLRVKIDELAKQISPPKVGG